MAVTDAYLLFEWADCFDFGYNWYSMLTLFAYEFDTKPTIYAFEPEICACHNLVNESLKEISLIFI